ncbi:MAG: peptide MFS transporter, partial [Flavitalea sp.]
MQQPTDKVKHPRGLYVLFFTEMWERFGYYLMIGILFLYLSDTTVHGGRGFDTITAIDIVGTYVALVYLTPFIGGLLADRFLGYTRSIFIGGSLMALGYFLLAVPGSNATMYTALLLVIIGNGFFKPNISTLLGNIYNKEELKPRKDAAYNIFYMGINIGAFACNFVASYLRNNYTWGYAFAAAGVGMLLGMIWFATGTKYVKHADVIKPQQQGDIPVSKIALYVFLPAAIAGAIGWFIPGNLIGSDSNDAFIFACVPIIIFYLSLWLRAKGFDKRRLGTLLTLFVVAIVFWNIYNQNSTALTIWAETYTNREMPSSVEGALKPFGMMQTIDSKPQQIQVMDNQFRVKSDDHGKVLLENGNDLAAVIAMLRKA